MPHALLVEGLGEVEEALAALSQSVQGELPPRSSLHYFYEKARRKVVKTGLRRLRRAHRAYKEGLRLLIRGIRTQQPSLIERGILLLHRAGVEAARSVRASKVAARRVVARARKRMLSGLGEELGFFDVFRKIGGAIAAGARRAVSAVRAAAGRVASAAGGAFKWVGDRFWGALRKVCLALSLCNRISRQRGATPALERKRQAILRKCAALKVALAPAWPVVARYCPKIQAKGVRAARAAEKARVYRRRALRERRRALRAAYKGLRARRYALRERRRLRYLRRKLRYYRRRGLYRRYRRAYRAYRKSYRRYRRYGRAYRRYKRRYYAHRRRYRRYGRAYRRYRSRYRRYRRRYRRRRYRRRRRRRRRLRGLELGIAPAVAAVIISAMGIAAWIIHNITSFMRENAKAEQEKQRTAQAREQAKVATQWIRVQEEQKKAAQQMYAEGVQQYQQAYQRLMTATTPEERARAQAALALAQQKMQAAQQILQKPIAPPPSVAPTMMPTAVAKPSIFDKIGKFFGIPGDWIKWGLVGVIILALAPVLIRLIRSIREAIGGEKD